MPFTQVQQQVLADVLPAFSAFKRTFGRDLSADCLAELYVAETLSLTLPANYAEHGGDAVDPRTGRRYQIKQRNRAAHYLDFENYEFDFLVLVNLNDAYEPDGIWLLPAQRLKEICSGSGAHVKHQISQERFKREAERIA